MQRVVILRHGESEANVAGLIVSDPGNGVDRYGLSPRGEQEAAAAAATLAAQPWLVGAPVAASDFLRTRQTAAVVAAALQSSVSHDERLRERHFGRLELQPSARYAEVFTPPPVARAAC